MNSHEMNMNDMNTICFWWVQSKETAVELHPETSVPPYDSALHWPRTPHMHISVSLGLQGSAAFTKILPPPKKKHQDIIGIKRCFWQPKKRFNINSDDIYGIY